MCRLFVHLFKYLFDFRLDKANMWFEDCQEIYKYFKQDKRHKKMSYNDEIIHKFDKLV